jgi:hypothetical protein
MSALTKIKRLMATTPMLRLSPLVDGDAVWNAQSLLACRCRG